MIRQKPNELSKTYAFLANPANAVVALRGGRTAVSPKGRYCERRRSLGRNAKREGRREQREMARKWAVNNTGFPTQTFCRLFFAGIRTFFY
jgi:hypothetical protein